MAHPRIASLAWTCGALVVAVAFAVAAARVVARNAQLEGAYDRAGDPLRALEELSAAAGALAREPGAEGAERSAGEAAGRLAGELHRWDAARRRIPAGAVAGVELEALLAPVDARIERARAAVPEFPSARREPAADAVRRLREAADSAQEGLQECERRLRTARDGIERERRAATARAEQLLAFASVVALAAALLVHLRRRDAARIREAEQARIASEQRLGLILAEAPVVLWSADRDLRVTSSHGAALRRLQLRPGELDGRTLPEYFGTADADFLPIARHRAALRGEPQRYEIRWQERDYFVQLVPMGGRDGPTTGVLGCAIDVTELKAAERALKESTARVAGLEKAEAIARLADTIAHDFNNFLTVILGNAGLALSALSDDSPVRSEIDEIARTAEHAARLTRQLLTFCRPQSFESEPVDLNAVIRDLEPILRRQCGDSIAVVVDLSPEPAVVRAHPTQIEQVLLNLVLNARDAMPSGGRLTIATARRSGPEPVVALSISDTGVGMDEEVRRRLFEPFFTTKSERSGIGLGLAIVEAVVRERGGTIAVESAPGRGSTFRILLPASAATAAAAPAERPDAPAPGRGETVLVVEDDESVRTLGRRALEASGYRVLEASSGEQAMELLARSASRVDLLLTDRRMPRMSGETLARWCRSNQSAGSVLVMTTHPDSGNAARAESDPELPILHKPFTSNDLLRRVREVLDRRDAPGT